MCPRLTAGEIDLMISQLHRKQCCDGVRCCLRTANLTELLKTAVVMRYQLARAARASPGSAVVLGKGIRIDSGHWSAA